MNYTADIPQKLVAAKFDLSQVLSGGKVLHARTTTDNIRVVTIEDVDAYFETQSVTTGRDSQIRHTVVGKGVNIERAFARALNGFIRDLSYGEMYRYERSGITGSAKASSLLDYWVLNHNGKLRAVKDFDNEIICELEGRSQPFETDSELIVVQGVGINFHYALLDAFSKAGLIKNPEIPKPSAAKQIAIYSK